MSNCIVLVKQVPDVSRISDNAFDPETGNLMRNRLPAVINELDAQALAFAARICSLGHGQGRIIALTMGPPGAVEVLRYGLERVVDAAVLLTDRALGGADTYATANPLAHACRRIAREILNGDDRYYIVTGMQSVDGDTAQVPAQLAAELGLPCVAFVTDVEPLDGRLVFSRIVSGGNELVVPRQLPAVVTVAKYEHPLFPTLSRTRWTRRTPVTQWGAADINATAVGTKGSKTWVVRIFAPPQSTRKRQALASPADFAQKLKEAYASTAGRLGNADGDGAYRLPGRRQDPFDRNHEVTDKAIEPFTALSARLRELGLQNPAAIDEAIATQVQGTAGLSGSGLQAVLDGFKCAEPTYPGDVWVAAELQSGEVHPSTFELLGKARELADVLEKRVGVVLLGSGVRPLAQSLIAGGADDVYLADESGLAGFDPGPYRTVLARLVEQHWPQIVLFAATPQGRTLAPMVSYGLHCGLTADCTGLDIRDNSRRGEIAILAQTRPALGGNVMATICTKDSRCQMATARPGVMKRLPPDPARTGRIIDVPVAVGPGDATLEILRTEPRTLRVDLGAEVIVSGGRGLQSKEGYARHVGLLGGALAKSLGVAVGQGASRAAVESGFAERPHQVGQTGTAVAPRVYVAMGISGAIQHMIGVANSGAIFAINSDPHAPILKQCDYYLVANAEEAVPEIVRHLEEA
ncbi:MAG: FAD-binding protein [Candidatus Latescibacterota bacterium]|jgi:electron transfer flavoprotein alpha subunit